MAQFQSAGGGRGGAIYFPTLNSLHIPSDWFGCGNVSQCVRLVPSSTRLSLDGVSYMLPTLIDFVSNI